VHATIRPNRSTPERQIARPLRRTWASPLFVLRKQILELFRHPETEFEERIEPDADAANTFTVTQDQFDLRS
jgi:hypothetical protein